MSLELYHTNFRGRIKPLGLRHFYDYSGNLQRQRNPRNAIYIALTAAIHVTYYVHCVTCIAASGEWRAASRNARYVTPCYTLR